MGSARSTFRRRASSGTPHTYSRWEALIKYALSFSLHAHSIRRANPKVPARAGPVFRRMS